MTGDSLRTLVERYDRANARRNRLTDAVVLPARPGAATRRVCGSCWHVVDEQGEVIAWTKRTERLCGCADRGSWHQRPRGWEHWSTSERRTVVHDYPGVIVCPNCGADALAEVTP